MAAALQRTLLTATAIRIRSCNNPYFLADSPIFATCDEIWALQQYRKPSDAEDEKRGDDDGREFGTPQLKCGS